MKQRVWGWASHGDVMYAFVRLWLGLGSQLLYRPIQPTLKGFKDRWVFFVLFFLRWVFFKNLGKNVWRSSLQLGDYLDWSALGLSYFKRILGSGREWGLSSHQLHRRFTESVFFLSSGQWSLQKHPHSGIWIPCPGNQVQRFIPKPFPLFSDPSDPLTSPSSSVS